MTLLVLGLYVSTAARDIVVGDTPELMTVAVTFGVAHPSGYPLLTLLGHAFSWLPIEPLAFRLNLMAALCGTITVGLVYVTSWRLTGSWPAAAFAAALLAVDPLFWEWSLVFEAFPLNNLLAAALVTLLVIWDEAPERTGVLVLAALVAGLASSNHLTIALLGPAILLLLWRHRREVLHLHVFGGCVVAFVAGLLPYAMIPWAASRHEILNWGAVSSVSDLLALVLRTDYGTGSLVANSDYAGGEPGPRLMAWAWSFLPISGPLLVAGAFHAWRCKRGYLWFALVAFVVAGPVFVAYANMNLAKDTTLWVLQRFFLLSHVVAVPLIAFATVWLTGKVASLAPGKLAPLGIALVVAAACGAVLWPAIANYRSINQRDNHLAGQYARDVLETASPGSVLLATGDDHGSPVAWAQAVEGIRPDVTLVLPPLLKAEWYVRHLRTRYPELQIPDKPALALTLKDIVDANQTRPIATVGGAVDKTLEGTYGYIRHGLVSRVEPLSKVFDLVSVAADNDTLLKRYHPTRPETIHGQTFEPQLLRSYAGPAEWVANRYRQTGYPTQAKTWYERALAIDPSYPEAKRGLAEVSSQAGTR